MSIWRKLLYLLGLRQDPAGPRYYTFEKTLQAKLANLAIQEGRTEEELAADLLMAGLRNHSAAGRLLEDWRLLSPREQDVTALVCLGYTNRQIAAHLGISAETVKTHLGNVLTKFGLHSRGELRLRFSEWDFGAWES
jgi:DNA-binding CsgD family transcriptional regulator